MKPAQKLIIPQDRHERLHYIKRTFSDAKGPDLQADWAGGRPSALKKLNDINAVAYAKNSNFLNGAVTHLSPYLRHGCLTLHETFENIKKKFDVSADKLVYELAWRDYWRRVWVAEGNAIFSEMEASKVAIEYAPLSDDVIQGKTGLPCMDGFINEDLIATGYVHNHPRMWLASYIVHHRKIDWRAAADWFEAHLIDGDIASNHLSWQWVTSTFSSKPYFFNKENLSRYTGGKYCADCHVQCPFDASYEILSGRLFSQAPAPMATAKKYVLAPVPRNKVSHFPTKAIFVHDEMLSSAHALLQKPFPKIFVFDPQLHGTWSLNRLQFVADCLNEMDEVEVWVGDTYEILMQKGIGQLITQDTPNLKVKELLSPFVPDWQPVTKFINVEISEKRLKRFSRYWEKVGPLVLSSTVSDKNG
jgi:deoxyribodipyrimidine photo-lyase